jgi:hypothetical protein
MKKRKDQNIKVDFRIVDFDFHPDIITQDLEVKPSEIWFKNDFILPNTQSQVRYKTNGWSVQAEIDDNLDLSTHFSFLIEKLSNIEEKLSNYCRNFYGEFACTIYLIDGESVPIMHLTQDIINFTNKIGAEIDFDIYNFPKDNYH